MVSDVGIEEAVRQATLATGQFKHGAVLMHGKKVIAAANNTHKYHAERRALMVCPRHYLKNKRAAECVMYVARVNNQGCTALSKPCPACQRVIEAMNVRVVFFTV